MATKTGLCEFIYYTAVDEVTVNQIGIVNGGSFSIGESPQHVQGVGGLDVLVGSPLNPTISVDFKPTGINELITTYSRRDTESPYPCNLPTPIDMYVGMKGEEQYKLSDCYLNSLTIDASIDEQLSCSAEFLSLKVEVVSDSEETMVGGTPFVWYKNTAEIGDLDSIADAGIKSWSFGIENNLETFFTMNAKDDDEKRFPDGIVAGNEVIKLSITTVEELSSAVIASLADDTPVDFKFQGTASDGTNILTLDIIGSATSLAGVAVSSIEQPIQSEGIIEYSYEFEIANNGNTSVWEISIEEIV
jgi:hypothetical protein